MGLALFFVVSNESGREWEKRKGAFLTNAPLSGNRTPGSNQYRCFLSDLTEFSAQPPPGFPRNWKNLSTGFKGGSSTIIYYEFKCRRF